ncbi:hypothetical protein Tco_0025823 [Tanacetum coccineum]
MKRWRYDPKGFTQWNVWNRLPMESMLRIRRVGEAQLTASGLSKKQKKDRTWIKQGLHSGYGIDKRAMLIGSESRWSSSLGTELCSRSHLGKESYGSGGRGGDDDDDGGSSGGVVVNIGACQPNSPQLNNEDLQQMHPDELEEMDLR